MIKRLFGSGSWRPRRDLLGAGLGRLERAVMEVLWEGGDLPVRDVQARLARPVAYTTVMTTLDRLFKKGFVDRRREGRAFVYRPAFARHEMEATVTTGLLTDVLANGGDTARPFLSNLVDAVAERDDRLLDELERLVRDKRLRLKKGQE